MPDDPALLVDDERVWYKLDVMGVPVRLRRGTVLVDGDGVIHLVAHLLHERLDVGDRSLVVCAHANERDVLVLVLFLHLGDVRNAPDAREAAGVPEVDYVDALAVGLGHVNWLPLDPILDVQRRGLVAELVGVRRSRHHERGEQCEGPSSGLHR